MDLIIFGIQGSGKGTQAKILAVNHKMKIFEAGAQCRKLAEEDSDLGKRVKNIIENGELVPQEIIMALLDKFLSQSSETDKIIYDGIPRNEGQYLSFDQTLKKWNRDFIAINIELPEEETIKRLLLRSRNDDKPEIITNRIKIFIKETAPIIEIYKSQNKVININGNQSIEDVTKEIESKIFTYLN